MQTAECPFMRYDTIEVLILLEDYNTIDMTSSLAPSHCLLSTFALLWAATSSARSSSVSFCHHMLFT